MERAQPIESFGDKARAFGFALGLHLVVIAALLIGLWWTNESKPVVMPGPVIEATLIGPTAAPKSGSRRPTPPKPAPEPVKQEPKPEPPKPTPEPPKPEPPAPKPPQKETPAEVQKQDQIDQEKIAAVAEQKADEQKREQEEKQKQRQVLLDEQEKQRKIKEEQQKQLADIKKEREAAEKSLNKEKQKLAQLEDHNRQQAEKDDPQPAAEQEAPKAMTGANGQDNDLTARYAAAIQAAVTQNWNRPDSASTGLRCSLNIVQIPGGDVISVTVGSPCNADQPTRNSIEQAVMKAAPLPYQGYEKVFQRSVKFNFKYDGQ
ncbi:MAG: cell envelope integrity protein TolA [Dokdonella sp.]